MIDLDAAYTILVEECGASEGWRDLFVAQMVGSWPLEYRFQGGLGFGGKFRSRLEEGGWRHYVDCYREDETSERLAMIRRANARRADAAAEEGEQR
jgi:hypothetical protein